MSTTSPNVAPAAPSPTGRQSFTAAPPAPRVRTHCPILSARSFRFSHRSQRSLNPPGEIREQRPSESGIHHQSPENIRCSHYFSASADTPDAAMFAAEFACLAAAYARCFRRFSIRLFRLLTACRFSPTIPSPFLLFSPVSPMLIRRCLFSPFSAPPQRARRHHPLSPFRCYADDLFSPYYVYAVLPP